MKECPNKTKHNDLYVPVTEGMHEPYISEPWPEGTVTVDGDMRLASISDIVEAMRQHITEQRAKGWTEFHPETYCHRCGGKNVRSWFVASDRFNLAVEALGLAVTAIICPGCFVEGHEKATGLQASWELVPTTPFRPKEGIA